MRVFPFIEPEKLEADAERLPGGNSRRNASAAANTTA